MLLVSKIIITLIMYSTGVIPTLASAQLELGFLSSTLTTYADNYVLVKVIMSTVYCEHFIGVYRVRVKFQSVSPFQPFLALIQLHFEETSKQSSLRIAQSTLFHQN